MNKMNKHSFQDSVGLYPRKLNYNATFAKQCREIADRSRNKPNTVKIAELPKVCRDPGHNPPSMRVFSPGVWQHTCPSCGAVMTFTVEQPWL